MREFDIVDWKRLRDSAEDGMKMHETGYLVEKEMFELAVSKVEALEHG